MKRIWFGAGLLLALLMLGLLSGFLLEHSQLQSLEKLEQAAEAASRGDWAGARVCLAQSRQHWERQFSLFSALCDHEPIEQAESLYARLEVYADERSILSFRGGCAQLAAQLEALGSSHSLTFENFF